MSSTRRSVFVVGMVGLMVASVCVGNSWTAAAHSAISGAEKRALPPPVQVRPEPEGVTLADPAFDPLPSAHADYGTLGGAVYQIETPDRWNGRLVLWMHGFEELCLIAASFAALGRALVRRVARSVETVGAWFPDFEGAALDSP